MGSEMCIRDRYVSGGYKNIWIVACGSSSNGSLCARQFIRRHLKCEVKIVTPFNFVSSENDFGETDMVVVVSQSGYSLNALDAIKVIEAKGRRCIGLTGDVNSDLGKVCDVVANYGVGRETVAVSYTHLTLPTKRIVEISVVRGS